MADGARSPAATETCSVANAVRCLGDSDRTSCANAVRLLGTVSTGILASHADALAVYLAHDDWRVRLKAVEVLGRLEPDDLAPHSAAVARCLETSEQDDEWIIRAAAMRALTRLLENPDSNGPAGPAAFAEQMPRITRRLLDSSRPVRRMVSEALVRATDSSDTAVRWAATAELIDLSPRDMTEVAAELAEISPDHLGALLPVAGMPCADTLLHCAARFNQPRLTQLLLCGSRAALDGQLHAKNADGSTPLHLASEGGHADICRMLVCAGAHVRARNHEGRTSADLAESAGRKSVVHVLSRERLFSLRGGPGDALQPALGDSRPLVRVEWYTMALPGMLGQIGAMHSLLALTVGGTAEVPHTYLLEKASAISQEAEEADKAGFNRHGVVVSHWQDVAPLIDGEPIYSLGRDSIENHTGHDELCFKALWDIAVGLGPYDPGSCNCHHAALAVYNACAQSHCKVPTMPNHILTLGVRALCTAGFDPGNSLQSGSCSSASVVDFEICDTLVAAREPRASRARASPRPTIEQRQHVGSVMSI